ncbi:LPS translocon maturation chaperone LptM [Simplicispira psychrophila]|uniref:LPS translocon maturation chaperone LptM n=1 Tax=Simplicispira psychrophila TaxID=80882 RepID=UPI000A06B26E|nr:lipoprotein [Simplicispira psychrophila]
MLKAFQILARHSVLGISVAVLCACGQRGPLFLPTKAAAGQQATLPQVLTPAALRTTAPTSAPAAPAPSTPRTTATP